MKTITLNHIKPGERVEIVHINSMAVDIKRRLIEMGIIAGASIMVKRIAPLGDPMEIRLRGYSLLLRKKEAAHITVIRISDPS